MFILSLDIFQFNFSVLGSFQIFHVNLKISLEISPAYISELHSQPTVCSETN